MACECNKYVKNSKSQCLICAEKHFAAAKKRHLENSYSPINRVDVIGDLSLCEDHLYKEFTQLSQHVRDLRHLIQYRRENETADRWNFIAVELDKKISEFLDLDQFNFNTYERGNMQSSELRNFLPAGESVNHLFRGNIYLFSNVKYPFLNRINPNDSDLLVFLNTADSFKYYYNHPRKIVVHRSPLRDYGDPQPCRNIYLFNEKKQPVETVPESLIQSVKSGYDMNYDSSKKIKTPTTGYFTVRFLQKKFPNAKLYLVNFGSGVKHSTYRYPAHNWEYENDQLSEIPHISTEA